MSFIQSSCERGAKSHVAKEVSGRGRRRSRRDEKGNQGVGDFRFINILQFFSIYYYYFIIFSILFFIHDIYPHLAHTHTRDPHSRPTTSAHYPRPTTSPHYPRYYNRDECVGTWDSGTRDKGLEDIKYGTRGRVGRGRGDVKYRDAGDAGCE